MLIDRSGKSIQQNDHRHDTPPRTRRSLSGWGNSPNAISEVVRPETVEDLIDLQVPETGYVARGLGRSYGDAAILGGGLVLEMTAMNSMVLDVDSGVVSAGAGTSLGDIIDVAVEAGWFLPVTPGTRHVTVGGAIAADVHGKNHHREGSLGQYVDSFDLLTGDGSPITVTPGTNEFAATVGGMGLTGTITRASLRLKPIESPWMSVDTVKGEDLHSVMQLLSEADERRTYSVAWVDITKRGRGRGIVTSAEHARREQKEDTPPTPSTRTLTIPAWIPGGAINDWSVNAFNQAWYSMAPQSEAGRLESLESYFYPLDRISLWNRLYGRRGFIQYQFVVPNGQEATLINVARTLAGTRTPVALAVLKRMGASEGGLLSFPQPGWTLALDMPLGDPDLATVLDDCDRLVAGAGGRVYLAKDARMRADVVGDMYPDLSRWRELRAILDPRERIRSNLSERLLLAA
ncbi:MAG: FAD-dependent oxidoreductase [Actinomycetota bacterium]